MDYKEIRDTMAWHSTYSTFGGREWQLLAYLITQADYRTGEIQISYADLGDDLGSRRTNVARSIKALIDQKAIHISKPGKGRSVNTYRVRTGAELDKFFSTIEDNRKFLDWMKESDRLCGNMIEAW